MKKLFYAVILVLMFPTVVGAQYLNSSYFMDASAERLSINPALKPARGFINIPVVGAFHVDAATNLPDFNEISGILDGDVESITNSLMDNLQPVTTLDMNLNFAPVSFGFYAKKHFFTVTVNTRTDINADVPKTIFEFIQDVNKEEITGNHKYSIINQNLCLNMFSEVGVGYAKTIGDRLTVGGKFKMLLGMAKFDLNVNRLEIDGYFPNPDDFDYNDPDIFNKVNDKVYANITTDTELKLSGKGFKLKENEDGYISDVELDELGLGGYGAAIDLGVHLKVTDNIDISASVLDLGFIKWSEENTIVYESKKNFKADNLEELELFDFNIFGIGNGINRSLKTNLASTLVIAGEYRILEDKLGFGILSTTRFMEEETKSKLSAIVTFRPAKAVNVSLSYTTLSGYNSLGGALKLGPLFIGTDYIMGKTEKRANAYLGISIPLGPKNI